MEERTPSASSLGDGQPNATCPGESPARQCQGTFEPGFRTWRRSQTPRSRPPLEAPVARSGAPVTASHLRHVCGGETPCPEMLHAQTSEDDSPSSRKGQQEHLPSSAPAPPSSEHVVIWEDGRRSGGGAFGDSVRAPGGVGGARSLGEARQASGAWLEATRGVAFGYDQACTRTSLGGTERTAPGGGADVRGRSGKARGRVLGGAGMDARTWRRLRGVPACGSRCRLELRGGRSLDYAVGRGAGMEVGLRETRER